PWPIPRSANPAGGLASTVRDQLRYARFHLGDGTAPDGSRILSATAMAAMQQPSVPAFGDSWIGVSWGIRESGGLRLVMHGGGTNGQASAFMLIPSERFAITV